MNNANFLLFEKKYGEQPLFINQLDLADQLLNSSSTGYFIEKNNQENYYRAQNRLKAYISQLLSQNVTRNITEDFIKGLTVLISNRLSISGTQVDNVVKEIILSLKEKNTSNTRVDTKRSVSEQFYTDLRNANYLAIINSNPLEINLNDNHPRLSMFLFLDLIDSLRIPEKDIKYYRFNFPLESSCILFWKGLKKALINYYKKNIKPHEIISLYQKFAIKTETFNNILKGDNLALESTDSLVNEILELLNRNRFILTFTVQAPIFSLPMIIVNPAEFRNCRVYALLDDPQHIMSQPFKFSESDGKLWRLFVWDKLKSKQFAGVETKYSQDL